MAPPAVLMLTPSALLLAMIRLPLTSTDPPAVEIERAEEPPMNKSPPVEPFWVTPPTNRLPPPVERLASKITMPAPSREGLALAVEAAVLLSASMTKCKRPLPPVWAMSRLMTMVLAARSVSVTSPLPLDLLMASETVKFPRSPPPEKVVTVTLVPPFKRLLMPVAEMLEPSLPLLADPELPMVMLVGSNNHSPALPMGAAAEPVTPSTWRRPPEVSICPPSPP